MGGGGAPTGWNDGERWWLLSVDPLNWFPFCILSSGGSVAFPNRKSYFFDNKLEFSDIKIAIGQGFR